MKTALRLALALALAATGAQVIAATTTGNLAVNATVVATCRLTTTAVGFTNYDGLSGAATDGQGSLGVTCTQSAPYTIALDAGAHAALATAGARAMINATGQHLDYNLYSDSARGTLWGGTVTVPGSGNGAIQTVNVYGRVPANQSVPAGSYSDTVQVTVTF